MGIHVSARMMRAGLLLALVAATAVLGAPEVGNPRHTTADVSHFNLVQTSVNDDVDVAATDGMTDETLVEAKFATVPQPVNLENLRTFVAPRGIAAIGMMSDLVAKAACILRVEADIGAVISTVSLQNYLTAREMSPAGSRDDMFERACDYQKKESATRLHLNKTLGDITVDDLKNALTNLGFIATSGTKAELVYRLGKAHIDVQTVRRITGDSEFDTSDVHDMLGSRGLEQDGSASEKLGRLASYLAEVHASVTSGAVHEQCDMVFSSSVCLDGGNKVIAPSSIPRGQVLHMTFDDALMLDSSGFGHHAHTPVAFGPGVFNSGMSAKFDGTNMLEIPHTQHLDTTDFCITFWIYLNADSTGQWRSIIHKGNHDHERTPSIFLEPQTRGLEMFVETDAASMTSGERLWSNTFLPLYKWTHVAACAEVRNLRMFINGMLDAENTTVGNVVLNTGPIFVGNDPWRPYGGTDANIDELRIYNRNLSPDEIQAQAAMALGGVESSFVELGCMGCSLDSCPKACRRGYRMCTARDLESGAYQVGRSMGWANSETRVWKNEDSADAADTPDAA